MIPLTAYPKNQAQKDAVLAFLAALKIPYEMASESKEETYGPRFEAKMKKAEADFKAGRSRSVKTTDLWK